MRITIAVLLTFLLILVVSAPLLAKATTTKVTISGVGLKTPIEISDPDIVANFTVWTRTADHGLIIDWSQGPVRKPPDTLRRYQVSFYAGAPPNERIVYVVYYVFNPDAGLGYVYLPGKSDEYYRLNYAFNFARRRRKMVPRMDRLGARSEASYRKAKPTDFNAATITSD